MPDYTLNESLTAKIRLIDEALKSRKLRAIECLQLIRAKARFLALQRYNDRLPTRH